MQKKCEVCSTYFEITPLWAYKKQCGTVRKYCCTYGCFTKYINEKGDKSYGTRYSKPNKR